jgi:two-component system catabolic regulation response regulator CreB
MPTGPSILLVEDERAIADTVLYALRTEGFDPQWCATLGDAKLAIAQRPPALVVLDVGLPDGNGFDFCRWVRSADPHLPVIFLTARSEVIDRVVGLEIGGDDYLAKPFSPRELTARVKAVLRRRPAPLSPSSADSVQVRDTAVGKTADFPEIWYVDEERCRISYRSVAIDLTATEFRLLRCLIAHPGRVYSRDQLMQAAWPDPGSATDRTVDAHVKAVRAKLRIAAPAFDPIQTHRGLGYALREEG